MKKYAYSPLAVAMALVLTAPSAFANDKKTDEPTANLGILQVTTNRQGAKIRTNVVTTAIKDESTATDLRGLLQAEPAIDFSGGNGTSQYISIRGMGQNSVDVKVDNAHSDAQILYHQGRHMLDPSLVKIVSVQKGAGSASAGIGQTNGAIIAKTLDAHDLLKTSGKDWGFKVNGGYSTNSEHSYGLTGFGKAGGFDFLLSYNQVNQDNYKPGRQTAEMYKGDGAKKYVSPYSGSTCVDEAPNKGVPRGTTIRVCQDPNHPSDEVAFQSLDKVSYLAKAGYTFGDHRFVLSHFNTTNKGKRNVREEFDWFSSNNARYRELSLENTNLEYKGKNLGFANTVEANAYVMKNTRQSDDDYNSNYGGGVVGHNTASVKTQGANLNLDSNIAANTLLKYGVNYRNQEISPNRANSEGTVNHTKKTDTGLYAEAIHDIGNFTLTGGLRYDHFDYTSVTGKNVSDGAVNPSVGIIWQATPSLSFNVVHNYATRSPRLVDALVAGGSNVTIADGTKAEQAKNTEVGFNFTHNNFSADGSYFWQKIDNLLANGQVGRHRVGEIGAGTLSAIANVGYGKNKGFEINTRYKYNGLTARLGVAQSKPEYHSGKDDKGNNIRFDNREFGSTIGRTWTMGLAYRPANSNFEMGINHRKIDDVTGQSAYMTQIDGARGNDLSRIKYGYNVTDIYTNWKPYGNDKLNINLALNNLTDEYYRPHTTNGGGLPAAGREVRVGFNYTY